SGRPLGQPVFFDGPPYPVPVFKPGGRIVQFIVGGKMIDSPLADELGVSVRESKGLVSHLWEVPRGPVLGLPLLREGNITAATFSPDGKVLLTGTDMGLGRLWDVATGKPLGQHMLHPARDVLQAEFSPDGKTVATRSTGRTILLWEAAT